MPRSNVVCPYCGYDAVLTDSSVIYGQSHGLIWLCDPCGAWVGVHTNSPRHAPLGTLADARTRYWRQKAHEAFDPVWKYYERQGMRRWRAKENAYAWLAKRLGVGKRRSHIGYMDVELCHRTIDICEEWKSSRGI